MRQKEHKKEWILSCPFKLLTFQLLAGACDSGPGHYSPFFAITKPSLHKFQNQISRRLCHIIVRPVTVM